MARIFLFAGYTHGRIDFQPDGRAFRDGGDVERCDQCGARLARDNPDGRCRPCQARQTAEIAGPPELPADFWEHESLGVAFAARHVGRLIRAYRHHPAHGPRPLAQGVVAAWANLSQAQLSRLETGAPVVHLDRLMQWADLLHIPERYLWFALSASASDADPVKRRNFLTLAGVTLGGVGLPPAAPEPGASLTSALGRLASVMLTATPGSEPTDADELARQVRRAWNLRQRASYEALADLLPSLLGAAQTSADVGDGSVREAATRVVVHTYNAASSLLKRFDDSSFALLAADRAVGAARSLGDPLLLGAARFRLANVLLAGGRPVEARAVATQAADLTTPTATAAPRSLALWGALLLTGAVAAARSGDASGAWELMGEARTASRLLGTDYADLYAIFGPTNVAIHGVQVAVELGNGRDGIQRSRQVDTSRLPSSLVERRGQLLLDIARAHQLAGDDDTAVHRLTEARQTAPEEVRLSPDARDLTRQLLARQRVRPSSSLRELADFVGVS